MELTFLGATGTVTGSKYLLRDEARTHLVDCGLFQGQKQMRQRNWEPFPVAPRAVDSVVLTHAHLDHSGYLPVLVKQGFAGNVYCSPATREMCGILLPDAGHLQEEEARYANKRGFSRHRPALPLFTVEDATLALKRLVAVDFETRFAISDSLSFRLHKAGHILGASIVAFEARGRRIVFSGDLGRSNDAVMCPPAAVREADYLVVESTYGNRRHPQLDVEEEFAGHLNRALGRGGVVVIPAFAVGRAQSLLHHLARLKQRRAIPDVAVFLNSPMAVNATRLYCNYRSEHRLTTEECERACAVAKIVNTPEESRALNGRGGPMIIISASGMAAGGRVVHHLKAFAPDPRNMVLFAGFQAAGTRGAAMTGGADEVRIHGEHVPVRAEVVRMDSLSAHADSEEILGWLRGFSRAPAATFVTHGEPAAADALCRRIEAELHWICSVPAYLQKVTLE